MGDICLQWGYSVDLAASVSSVKNPAGFSSERLTELSSLAGSQWDKIAKALGTLPQECPLPGPGVAL